MCSVINYAVPWPLVVELLINEDGCIIALHFKHLRRQPISNLLTAINYSAKAHPTMLFLSPTAFAAKLDDALHSVGDRKWQVNGLQIKVVYRGNTQR